MTVGLNTETDLQIFTELQEAFDKDKECEHPAHETQTMFHSGHAEWYVQINCENCDHTSTVHAICDKWVRTAERTPVRCVKCGWDYMCTFLVKERIK